MRRVPIFVFLIALLSAARPGVAQVIIGQVFDETSGTAVTAAEVILVDRLGVTHSRSVADSAGWFRLTAPLPGAYRVHANSLGYSALQTIELKLEKGIELHLELRLSSAAIPHEPLRIVARRNYRQGRLGEYYDRSEWTRKTGNGRVYTREDIERQRFFDLSSIVRTVPVRPGCDMTYMLDGLPIELDLLDSMIRPEEVEGVEIYRGAHQVPTEYMGRVGCGLVLVWSRVDPPGMRPFTWKRLAVGLGIAGLLLSAGTLLR
jgi:hypothetical protein